MGQIPHLSLATKDLGSIFDEVLNSSRIQVYLGVRDKCMEVIWVLLLSSKAGNFVLDLIFRRIFWEPQQYRISDARLFQFGVIESSETLLRKPCHLHRAPIMLSQCAGCPLRHFPTRHSSTMRHNFAILKLLIGKLLMLKANVDMIWLCFWLCAL